jgi:hypothetical protein
VHLLKQCRQLITRQSPSGLPAVFVIPRFVLWSLGPIICILNGNSHPLFSGCDEAALQEQQQSSRFVIDEKTAFEELHTGACS